MSLTISKISFVVLPLVFLHICKIGVVEVPFNLLYVGVEESAFAVKLVVAPISLVYYRALRVKKSAITVHVVIFPLAIVDTAALIVKFAISVSFFVLNESFIFRSVFVALNDERCVLDF